MLKSFRLNPLYLAEYHARVGFILFAINCALFFYLKPSLLDIAMYAPAIALAMSTDLRLVIASFFYAAAASVLRTDFQILNVAIAIPVMTLLSLTFSAFIHNASHESFPKRWLNRLVGELIGVVQLSGFPDWKIIHVLHHQNSDDPVLDPHPPLNKSYWEFAKGMRSSIVTVFGRYYFQCFGQNEESLRNLQKFATAAKFNMLMKVCFWFLVLKPQLFAFAFLYSIVFKMLHFAWFNYITHRPESQGVVIRNMKGPVYKFINAFSFGLYDHENHHTAPTIFNPQSFKKDESATASRAAG